MQNWPTQEEDLLLAQVIIDKHVDLNDGKSLDVFEYVVENRLELKSEQPEWVLEIMDVFQQQYGLETGLDISFKVFSRCMIDGETIH